MAVTVTVPPRPIALDDLSNVTGEDFLSKAQDAGALGKLFAGMEGLDIPDSVTAVRTIGDTVPGLGAAVFTTETTGSPYARTFDDAGGRTFEMQADAEGWSLAAWGMLESLVADTQQAAINRDAHQSAVDHAQWLDLNGYGTQRIYFTPGQYFVDGAIKVFSWDEDTGAFGFISMEIAAPARGYVANRRTSIRNTNGDQPCYVVQKSRNVKFSGFSIVGANPPYNPTYPELVGDPAEWANPQNMRENRWSPACGICVDPFSLGMADDDKYPQLTAYYTSSSGGSSATVLENMEIQGFPLAVCLSPSLATQNNDSVMIRDCDLTYNTVAVATCQSQNRAVRVENCRIGSCHIMIDTLNFGSGNGAFPLVKDLNITFCKYLINSNSGVSRGKMIDCDVESTFSLGNWGSGGFPLDIEGCQIKLVPPVNLFPVSEGGSGEQQANIDYHLYNIGPVNIVGGYVGFYSNVPVPLSIGGGGKVSFIGACTDTPAVAEYYYNVYYDQASMRYLNAGNRYGCQRTFTAATEGTLAVQVDAVMQFGARAVCGVGANSTIFRSRSGPTVFTLESSVTLTVAGDGTATFPITVPERYIEDEWVSTSTAWDVTMPNETTTATVRNVVIGQVASVGATEVTLRCVPIGLTTGTHTIVTQTLRPFRRRAIATATSGSDILTGVVPSDHGFLAGERLLGGSGIQNGTYITAVDTGAGTITLSIDANASGQLNVTSSQLYLEEASASAIPTTGVYFQGDFVRNTSPTKDASDMVLTGWVCTASGNPGTFEPQYVSAVSPAT